MISLPLLTAAADSYLVPPLVSQERLSAAHDPAQKRGESFALGANLPRSLHAPAEALVWSLLGDVSSPGRGCGAGKVVL